MQIKNKCRLEIEVLEMKIIIIFKVGRNSLEKNEVYKKRKGKDSFSKKKRRPKFPYDQDYQNYKNPCSGV